MPHYMSTDESAPQIDGSTYSFLALLDACLVNGYGTQVAAGWTKPYTSAPTTTAVYRNGTGATRKHWRFRDGLQATLPFGIGTFHYIAARGYETMDSADVGQLPFPTVAQYAGEGREMLYHKIGLGAVPWHVFADKKTAYVFIEAGRDGRWSCIGFGDLHSFQSPDAHCAFLNSGHNSSGNGYLGAYWGVLDVLCTALDQGVCYGARDFTGATGAILLSAWGDVPCTGLGGANNTTPIMRGPIVWPNPVDGATHLAPVSVGEVLTRVPRGRYRGLWHWLHTGSGVATGDSFPGTGEYAGKTFYLIVGGPQQGVFCVELPATWEP